MYQKLYFFYQLYNKFKLYETYRKQYARIKFEKCLFCNIVTYTYISGTDLETTNEGGGLLSTHDK